MKASEILRKAAQAIESGRARSEYSCIVISHCVKNAGGTIGNEFNVRALYATYMAPVDGVDEITSFFAWGCNWPDDELKDCRILALCFAAAIAESEGN
jgi:hypothetical protein